LIFEEESGVECGIVFPFLIDREWVRLEAEQCLAEWRPRILARF
jgi:hypothetical protein